MSQSDFVTRGQALVASGQYQEAVKVCRLGLLGRPTTVEGRVVLGQALLALKRYDEVLAEMRVALELDHASIPAQMLKGEALLRKGDAHGALDVLQKLRPQAPTDPRVDQLLGEAESLAGRPTQSSVHPSVGYVRAGTGGGPPPEESTKHYVNHSADTDPSGDEDTGGSYTRPTSIQAPGSKKRSAPQPLVPPPAAPRSNGAARSPDRTPSPAVLAVGDRSGTVEVDPELDGVELRPSEDDMGGLAPPPPSRSMPAMPDPDARGGVMRSRERSAAMAAQVAAKRPRPKGPKQDISTVELEDDDSDLVEVESLPPPRSRATQGPGAAVRPPPGRPTGVTDNGQETALGRRPPPPKTAAFGSGGSMPPAPRATGQAPAHLAQLIASQPHLMHMSAPMPVQQQPPPPPMPPAMQMQQAGYLQPMPGGPMSRTQQGMPPPPVAGTPPMNPAVMPTMAMPPAPSQLPPTMAMPPVQPMAPMPQPMPQPMPMAPEPVPMYQPDPVWARPQGGPAPMPPQPQPPPPPQQLQQHPPIDAALSAILNEPLGPNNSAFMNEPSASGVKAIKGKKRSKLQLAVWFVIGAAVIGGGIFAGLQIRAMRLNDQIDNAEKEAARDQILDTWKGWVNARGWFANIQPVSDTAQHRAALARARGLVAFEFHDGLAEAKAETDRLGADRGLDGEIAAAYVALAQNDGAAALTAAKAALAISATDATALYVGARAQLLLGDTQAAIAGMTAAHAAEKRPLFAVGLAEALAAEGRWDDGPKPKDAKAPREIGALSAIKLAYEDAREAKKKKDALDAEDGKDVPAGANDPTEFPSAVIAHAMILVTAGRIGPNVAIAGEIKAQLQKVIAEGGSLAPSAQNKQLLEWKATPVAEQPRGVSPGQVAFANLALAQVDFLRNDPAAAQADFRAALAVNFDEQRFAEQAVETLLAIGELPAAKAAADRALAEWPSSRRARIAKAQVLLAMGQPAEARDLLAKAPDRAGGANDLAKVPRALAVRGMIDVALGEPDKARDAFDAALKLQGNLDLAVVGRTWLYLAAGEHAAALKLIEPLARQETTTLPVATAYAAALARGDRSDRENARKILTRATNGAGGPDLPRAQLELARILRDLGETPGARKAYAEAIKGGLFEAQLESALLYIDDGDPLGGRDTLDAMLKTAGDKASPILLLEGARGRMLAGDDPGADQLLARADKLLDGKKLQWQLDRERGRFALRRNDVTGAVGYLTKALDGCGTDADTFLLAADAAAALANDEPKSPVPLADKVKKLAAERLANRPQQQLVLAKLIALGPAHADEASKLYEQALKALEAEKALPRQVAPARFGVGVTSFWQGNDPGADLALDYAIKLDPSLYSAYLYSVEINVNKDLNLAKAHDHITKAVQFNPQVPEAWYLYGVVAAKTRDAKMLNEAVKKLNELTPGSEALKQLQATQQQFR